jgi:GT2 family glycosyltransferase
MEIARGRFLVFTDDDCLMGRDYLRDLRDLTGEAERDLFIGGRVRLADPSDLKFTVKDVGVREVFREHVHPGGFLMGCNMVIARRTARRIGAFDTRFGAGTPLQAGEDTDYIIRAHMLGIRIEYIPGLDIYHRHGRKHVGQIRRLNRQYAYANGAIYAKHLFRAPWLKRHLWWTARAAARERFLGGPGFDERFGLTWGSLLGSHLLGIAGYAVQTFGAPSPIPRRVPS